MFDLIFRDSDEESDRTVGNGESDLFLSLFGDSLEGNLDLKQDYYDRPCYVTCNRKVILEAFSPIAKQAQDFLIAIAEPITRPNRIHEYKITEFSLYAAISVGLETQGILSVLGKLCKTELPSSIVDFIKAKTSAFGKVKLVLKHNQYWIESMHENVISTLLKDPIIQEARADYSADNAWITIVPDPILPLSFARRGVSEQEIKETLDGIDLFQDWSSEDIMIDSPRALPRVSISELRSDLDSVFDENIQEEIQVAEDDVFGEVITIDQQDEEESDLLGHTGQVNDSKVPLLVNTFQIKKESVASVRKQCSVLDLPLSEEYDFRKDPNTPSLDIDLKASTKLRDYQEEGLSKMFSSGRGRSGIIVLPCGAGKTLVGVTAACTIKKNCLILCTSNVSVDQWVREFKYWSTVQHDAIGKFTADTKEKVFFIKRLTCSLLGTLEF